MPYLSSSSVYLPPRRETLQHFQKSTESSWCFHLDSRGAATVGSNRERGAPVFDPDVTSVMDETRPANGKTQLFLLPIIWHPVSAVLYVGVKASLRRQKREDTGEKSGTCASSLSTCPSTGCNFPLTLSFLKLTYTRRRSWMRNVWLSWQHISKME